MSEDQRNECVLADPHHNNQKNADGKSGHDIRVDNRNLVHGGNQSSDTLSGIEGTDGPHGPEDGGNRRGSDCKKQCSCNHVSQLLRHKQRRIIMKGEVPDCTDIGRIRKAVHCQNQNRQIDKKQ